jgi:hypothetical protein
MSHDSKPYLYTVLSIALVACLWVGWYDFEPWIPQHEVRENIRSSIRWTIQFLVQDAIPAAIIIYFGREAYANCRAKQQSSKDAS